MVRFVSRFVGPLHVGDTCEVNLDVYVDDVLTDPTDLTIKVRSPAGVDTTYPVGANLVQASTGKYIALIDCTEAGTWRFAWKCPGPVGKAAEPGYFDVAATI